MVAGALFVARTQLRRRWRALAMLTILVGLVAGISISLIVGATRSSSVVERYFAAARHYDAQIFDQSSTLTQREVLAIPGVVRADPGAYLGLTTTGPGGETIAGINGLAFDWSARDPTTRLLEGSFPDGADPSEVVVNDVFVRQFGRSVGDTLDVRAFGRDQGEEVSNGVYEPTGPRYRFRIRGVVRVAADITLDEYHALGDSAVSSANGMLVSGEFYEKHRHEFLDFGGAYQLELEAGTSRKRLDAALRARTPAGEDPPTIIPVEDQRNRASLDAPVGLETTALWALGVGLALVGAIVSALILRAEQRAHEADTPILRALGSSASQLGAAAALRTLFTALGGTVIALGVALALSARYPIGIGRQLELERGHQVNLAVLCTGALVTLAFVLGCSVLFGLPRRARDDAPSRRASLASWLGRVGAPMGSGLGAYLAFARAGRARSVPSRQAIAGCAATLAIVTALSVYVAGVDHLHSVPDARGWRWDAVVGNVNFPLAARSERRLATDPGVRSQTRIGYGQAAVDGISAEFLAFDDRGDAPPEAIEGRLPRSPHEVALGAGLLDSLGVHLGSTVTFSIADGEFDGGGRTTPLELRVVGKTMTPAFGESDASDVGVVTLHAIAAAGGDDGVKLVLVRLRDHGRAGLRALDRRYTEEITTDAVPAQIVNLHRVRRLPLIGLAIAALMGVVVLLYVMAVSVRARTRDLAVLRAIGLPARQLRRVLAWEGSILATSAMVIGIPTGFLLGYALWSRVTDPIGVRGDLVVPPLMAVIVPTVALVAIGAALHPARRARREAVATLLHADEGG